MINWRVLLPTVLFLVVICWRLHTTSRVTVTTTLNSIREELSTGDLIFVNYNSKYGKLIRTCIGSIWSHVAVVLAQNGTSYIVEVFNYSGDGPEGLCVTPLQEWIGLNIGRVCGYKKYTGDAISSTQLADILKDYNGVKVDMDLLNWISCFRHIPNKQLRSSVKSHYFCSEFIALLLQRLQVLPKTLDPSTYSPHTLTETPNYNKLLVFLLSNSNVSDTYFNQNYSTGIIVKWRSDHKRYYSAHYSIGDHLWYLLHQ